MNREKHEKAAKRYAEVVTAHNKRKKRDGKVVDIAEVDQVAEADDNEEHSGSESAAGSKKQGSQGSKSNADGKTKGDDDEEDPADVAESINSEMTAMDVLENNADNVFQTLLGLPEISIETLYMAAKEKDSTILHLMNEHTNFI